MKFNTIRLALYGLMAGMSFVQGEWWPGLLLLGLTWEVAWTIIQEARVERAIEKLDGRRTANMKLASELCLATDIDAQLAWRDAWAKWDAYGEAIQVVKETCHPEGQPCD